MANRLWVVVALVMAPAVAVAEDLPFSRAELDEALRMRVAAEHRVEVAADGGGITVTVDGRSRSVVLGDEQGPAAARVVALVAAALAVEGPAAAAGATPPAEDDSADAGSAVLPAVDPAVVIPAVPTGRWQLGMRLAPGVGEAETVGFGGMVAREGRGRLRLSGALGYESRSIEPALEGNDVVTMHNLHVRGGVTLALDRRGRYAVSAAALVSPYLTRGGVGDRGVQVGGGAAARAVFALPSSDTDVLVEAGVDLMANQVDYRWMGEPALMTGRLRPWVTLGVSWEDH